MPWAFPSNAIRLPDITFDVHTRVSHKLLISVFDINKTMIGKLSVPTKRDINKARRKNEVEWGRRDGQLSLKQSQELKKKKRKEKIND